MKKVILGILMATSISHAGIEAQKIYTSQGQEVGFSQMLVGLSKSSVIIISELHGHAEHHIKQQSLIRALGSSGLNVSVGLEFIDYTKQNFLDEFLDGTLNEFDFLNHVGWGQPSFNYYREQTLMPLVFSGTTRGLNIPRTISAKVAKSGYRSLSKEERSLLPPQIYSGHPHYFERFKEAMGGGHIPQDKLKAYFEAQVLWDNTMAWQTSEQLHRQGQNIFVIIVGDFHASYSHGLAEQIFRYTGEAPVVISQVAIDGLTPAEISDIVLPHPIYGARGDFVWTSP